MFVVLSVSGVWQRDEIGALEQVLKADLSRRTGSPSGALGRQEKGIVGAITSIRPKPAAVGDDRRMFAAADGTPSVLRKSHAQTLVFLFFFFQFSPRG